MDTTHPWRIFQAASARNVFNSRSPYQWNRSLKSRKQLRLTDTAKQSNTTKTVYPTDLDATKRLGQVAYPKWLGKLRHRWKHISSTRETQILSSDYSKPLFTLACIIKNAHKRAAWWVLPFFVNENALEMTLNTRISSAAYITLVVASVKTAEPLIQKRLLPSYPKSSTIYWRSLQTIK